MDKLHKLLLCLSDGKFHSGEALGQVLGLSRSGVWKLVQQCRQLNITLESVTNRGYRLERPLTLLNKDKILAQVFPPFLQELKDIEIFDSLASTNDYLMAKAQTHPSGNWVCLAEHQSRGRGRRGRPWVSPFAKNLYFSILWRFALDASELSGLSLVTALTLVKTLEQYQIADLGLKWPNDVLWDFKKLAGILIEFSAEAHTTTNTVIGIGLNIDMPKNLDKHISQPWVDLAQITNYPIDRNELIGNLLNQLIEAFFLFQTEGLSPFIQEWQSRDLTQNRSVTVNTATTSVQGKGLGINNKGHLLIEMHNKEIQSFASGEVSIQLAPTILKDPIYP